MDDFEISQEFLSSVIESKISKVLAEKLTGLISELLDGKLKEINEKLDLLIDSVNENRTNITRMLSERSKESERKENAKEAARQIKLLNRVYINGAKSINDAKDMIETIIGREPTIKWIHQIEQKAEDDQENGNDAKENNPPAILAELSNNDKQDLMKLKYGFFKVNNTYNMGFSDALTARQRATRNDEHKMDKEAKGNKTTKKRNKKDTPCRNGESCTFGVKCWYGHDEDAQNVAPKNSNTDNADNSLTSTSANIFPEIHTNSNTTTNRIPKITFKLPKRPNHDEQESINQSAMNTKLRSSGRNTKNGQLLTPEGVI